MAQNPARQDRARTGASVQVKVEILDRQGRRLCDSAPSYAFPDRESAMQDVRRRLTQFDEVGYDSDGDFWWGRSRSGPGQSVRFLVK